MTTASIMRTTPAATPVTTPAIAPLDMCELVTTGAGVVVELSGAEEMVLGFMPVDKVVDESVDDGVVEEGDAVKDVDCSVVTCRVLDFED